ncbi:hypothetical protein ZWY2020_048012 [Hordeum vulgare]|nr:hypothetical protein ZWY2020_048012 [Hordeum vulgare]
MGGAADARKSPFGSSLMSVFMHADAADVALMVLGLVGAIGDGISTPVMLLITSRIFNDLGSGPDLLQEFSSKIDENARNLVFLALGCWVMAFLEGYCWSRTAERQASRMRARYLAAVLRQDVEYFDLKVGSTAEVIASVSNDSLVVQDVLSEKVPNFVMNAAMFFGSYAVALALLWRLTVVALPSVLLLIIPGFMYGRILIGLARRIREQYTRPGAVAEQAISSVRTVYSFAAERATMAHFSAALEESTRLGIKQGLAKGIAVGSNGITFAIWAFNVWYGSRLVMYHGYQGGTVFASSASIILGGLALGSGLSNVKYFSEASAAGERVLAVIRRVPKIDSGSDTGEELANVAGEVEFKKVEFCYPSRPESPIFSSFCLRVPAGRTAALVGSSGSGKSTVVALLERFYDPSGGEVALDGVDIRRLRLKWLRAQMGLVSQEPALFATSIMENILFGKEDATPEEVTAAAKAANAHNFISQLPQGYDTQDKTRAYALIFVALAVLSFLINIGQHYNFGAMGEYLTKRIREQMLTKILTFEIGWFDRDENSSGAICSQLAKDANVVRSLVGDRMALVIQTVSAVLIACTMGLVIAWRLALVMIAVQPLIIVCFYARRVLLKSMSKKSIQAQSESSKLAAEAVSNLRTITAFSSQDRILGLFNQAQNGPRKESIRQSWIAGLGLGTSMSLMTCTWALDFWFGGRLIAQHHITAKALFQTFMILVSTGRVIADAGSMTTDLAKGADAIASVFAVLDRVTEIDPDNPQGYKPEKLKGEVDIRGVDFAYPSRPDVIIFKGFSLSIQSGKSTALVGQSGSGKSTIIGLI